MRKIWEILLIVLMFTVLIFYPSPSYAISFGLIAPSETLIRGQEVTFTVTVDTQGENYETTRIGLTYDTQYLEFLNAIPGDTFSSISAEEIESGKLILTGSSDSPFTGEGVFAYVKFKLIAESPGSTQLCALFNPEEEPNPTQPPQSTPQPTPTRLPTSGREETTKKALIAASFFLLFPLGALGITKLKSS